MEEVKATEACGSMYDQVAVLRISVILDAAVRAMRVPGQIEVVIKIRPVTLTRLEMPSTTTVCAM